MARACHQITAIECMWWWFFEKVLHALPSAHIVCRLAFFGMSLECAGNILGGFFEDAYIWKFLGGIEKVLSHHIPSHVQSMTYIPGTGGGGGYHHVVVSVLSNANTVFVYVDSYVDSLSFTVCLTAHLIIL